MIVVRYADDSVLCFQHGREAEAFRRDLQQRVAKFGLSLHPEKTRLIRFGRHAAERARLKGTGKPATFDFLGFTHVCAESLSTQRGTFRRSVVSSETYEIIFRESIRFSRAREITENERDHNANKEETDQSMKKHQKVQYVLRGGRFHSH